MTASAVNTADLYDERGAELDSVSLQFQSLGARSHFSGPVRTIRCFEDNALVKATLATPGDGAVLVVDGGGSLRTALMGDMIAASAVANGWAGVVINGAIRDRTAIGGTAAGREGTRQQSSQERQDRRRGERRGPGDRRRDNPARRHDLVRPGRDPGRTLRTLCPGRWQREQSSP